MNSFRLIPEKIFIRISDGPCSLDYSKMKTPEGSWSDPSADELVLRHRIYGGTSSSSSPQLSKPQLFMNQISEPIAGAPHLAREHVDSLHQNAHSSLMFGKNNVVIDMVCMCMNISI